MRIYAPIAKADAELRMVWGYASTETQDDQGEVVTRAALEAALGEYMEFANIREMHQLSAVGVAVEAEVDERGLYVRAHVVDDRAWAKIGAGVYKGFSIGGRVKARDPANRSIITGLTLSEISLVDRPANPDSVFDCWKAEGAPMTASAALPPAQPMQVWDCGRADHRHAAKADALRCLERGEAAQDAAPGAARAIGRVHHSLALAEGMLAKSDAAPGPAGSKPYGDVLYADPGYRADGRKRYPIDTEMHIRAAWAYINRPKNARKYTPDQVAGIKTRIIAAWKEAIDPAGPASARAEAGEAGKGAKAALSASLRKGLCEVGEVAHLIVALHRLDERLAVEATIEADSSPQPARLQAIIGELCDFLSALVAEETQELVAGDGMREPPPPAFAAEIVVMAAGVSGDAVADILRKSGNADLAALTAALVKLGAPHTPEDQRLLDHVHSCLETLTDGACCMAAKAARHTKKTARHLQRAHDHLCAVGARCAGYAGAENGEDAAAAGKASRSHVLAKMRGDNEALIKTLDDIVPRLDRLARRVEDIARTPLPPVTHARGAFALSKRDDGGAAPEADEIVAALSRMSDEERTMALIKAAYANPIRAGGGKSPA